MPKRKTASKKVKLLPRRPSREALNFYDRTVIIAGFLFLFASFYSLATGDYEKGVPALAFGLVGIYWSWRKLRR